MNIFTMLSSSRSLYKTWKFAGQLWTHVDCKINIPLILII